MSLNTNRLSPGSIARKLKPAVRRAGTMRPMSPVENPARDSTVAIISFGFTTYAEVAYSIIAA